MKKRIVITGIGARCSNAKSYEEFVDVLKNVVPGQSKITLFNSEKLSTSVACQIQDGLKYHDLEDERTNKIAYEAIDELLKEKGIKKLLEDNQEDMILSYASSLSGNENMMGYIESTKDGNEENRELAYMIPNSVNKISRKIGIKGPVYTTMAACAAGTAAAGIGIDAIRNDETKVAVIGGADALTLFSTVGFHTIKSLSRGNCRPFDVDRDGINLGEASAFFIFEEYEHAKARNAKIYGEVLGYSAKNDAYHMTSPQPDGDGAYAVMKEAMRDANVEFTDEVIYINTHGTGTVANDEVELKAITRLFDKNPNVYISSTKSITGHCLGAAGSIELAVAAACLSEQFIPGTAHTQHVLETNDNIKIVISKSKEVSVDYVVSNSFAFAGNNACIILKKYTEE